MSPPCSDFTVATTSWMPDLSSSSFDFASMSLRLASVITPTWSTTRPARGEKPGANAAEPTQKSSANANSDAAIFTARPLELHLRRLFGAVTRSEFRHRLVSRGYRFWPEQGRERGER